VKLLCERGPVAARALYHPEQRRQLARRDAPAEVRERAALRRPAAALGDEDGELLRERSGARGDLGEPRERAAAGGRRGREQVEGVRQRRRQPPHSYPGTPFEHGVRGEEPGGRQREGDQWREPSGRSRRREEREPSADHP
jgi:hypothetical protein